MSLPRLFSILTLLLLIGCKYQYTAPINTHAYLHDELFPEHMAVQIETQEDIFAVDEQMKTFVHKRVRFKDIPKAQIRSLIEGIFHHSKTSLLYQNDANTVARETFANQAANCLSLTIMTYALADYAGFGATFQQVNIPELWVRRDGTSLMNRHVNLKLYTRRPTWLSIPGPLSSTSTRI